MGSIRDIWQKQQQQQQQQGGGRWLPKAPCQRPCVLLRLASSNIIGPLRFGPLGASSKSCSLQSKVWTLLQDKMIILIYLNHLMAFVVNIPGWSTYLPVKKPSLCIGQCHRRWILHCEEEWSTGKQTWTQGSNATRYEKHPHPNNAKC